MHIFIIIVSFREHNPYLKWDSPALFLSFCVTGEETKLEEKNNLLKSRYEATEQGCGPRCDRRVTGPHKAVSASSMGCHDNEPACLGIWAHQPTMSPPIMPCPLLSTLMVLHIVQPHWGANWLLKTPFRDIIFKESVLYQAGWYHFNSYKSFHRWWPISIKDRMIIATS